MERCLGFTDLSVGEVFVLIFIATVFLTGILLGVKLFRKNRKDLQNRDQDLSTPLHSRADDH